MIQPYPKSVTRRPVGPARLRPSCLRASVPSCLRHSSAFTLIELLVVIGIIALLAGIILVAVSRARGHASTARVMADLQAISTALEAYKSDFGDYPASLSTVPACSGGQMLAWAMVGPYNVVKGTNMATDGKDGPGFRAVAPGAAARGSVYGPYLEADKFLLPDGAGSYFLKDTFDQPILYFRRVAKPASNAPLDLYRVTDNDTVGTTPLNRANSTATARFDAMAQREKVTGPFLLWSAGLDGIFGPENPNDAATGPTQVKSCDDVLLSGGQ